MKKLILMITILALALSLAACQQTTESQSDIYVLSSVGDGENVSFLSTLDPANGYIRLEDDNTGMMLWNDTEQELTWDNQYIYWGGQTVPYMFADGEDAMFLLIFAEEQMTAIFRPMEAE